MIAAARAAYHQNPDRRVAIVTRNIRDFHKTELRRLGISLFDPDRLLSQMWQHDASTMVDHLRALPMYACAPGRQQEALDAMLKRERLFRLNRLCGDLL